MFTHVNNVLIAKDAPAAYTTVEALNDGDVALFDESGNLITTNDKAKAAKSVYVGVVTGKMEVIDEATGAVTSLNKIEKSTRIDKGMLKSYVANDYVAPAQQTITLNFTNVVIVPNNRYVLRIWYKDLFEDKSQFTHTYEVFAKVGMTAAQMAQAFAKKVNKHPNRRVNATVAGSTVTIVAMEKTDNEGIHSLSQYSIVSMEATVYMTDPAMVWANFPVSAGVVITTTVEGNPGKGYWKQVRDIELSNMGYKGHVMTAAHPEIIQERRVVEGTEYNNIVVQYNNLYRSNDNQYIKDTPLSVNLYVDNATTASIVGSTIDSYLKAFFGI